MKTRAILLFSLCLLLTNASSWAQNMAQRTKQNEIQVQGRATYSVGENEAITLSDAKERCLLRARINAIKEHFGDRIAVIEEEVNDSYFRQVLAESKADWLRDLGKPFISVSYQNDILTFSAAVKGVIREIASSPINIKHKMLTSGDRETNVFDDGDRFFLSLQSPVDGYAAVYLLDDVNKVATRMLPYDANEYGYDIKRGREYLFFDRNVDRAAGEFVLRTDLETEKNRLVIIFSKKPIPPCEAILDRRSSVDNSKLEAFNNWLYRCQSMDTGMVVIRDVITIKNNKK